MSEEAKQPRRRRRWLRFRLRTFLIVLTILCVWLGWYLYRVERQREAVKWVLESGGTVGFDYQINSKSYIVNDNQPPVPKWLLNILDVNYFSSVIGVSISDRIQITDLTTIADLPNLEVLHLYGSQVSDLKPLAGVKRLKWLGLEYSQVSDLTPLAGLTKLQELRFQGTHVSDVTPLAGLTDLESLYLVNTQVRDLTPLAGLKNLREFYLENTPVSDEEIENLQLALPNCEIITE